MDNVFAGGGFDRSVCVAPDFVRMRSAEVPIFKDFETRFGVAEIAFLATIGNEMALTRPRNCVFPFFKGLIPIRGEVRYQRKAYPPWYLRYCVSKFRKCSRGLEFLRCAKANMLRAHVPPPAARLFGGPAPAARGRVAPREFSGPKDIVAPTRLLDVIFALRPPYACVYPLSYGTQTGGGIRRRAMLGFRRQLFSPEMGGSCMRAPAALLSRAS